MSSDPRSAIPQSQLRCPVCNCHADAHEECAECGSGLCPYMEECECGSAVQWGGMMAVLVVLLVFRCAIGG